MPNWWVGTIKLSGRIENLKRFLSEGCCLEKEGGRLHFYDEDEKSFSCGKPGQLLYIEETRRNFIDSGEIHFCVEEKGNIGTLSFDFMSAWTVESAPYIKISKKYDIDIQIEGFERQIETVRIQIIQEREE